MNRKLKLEALKKGKMKTSVKKIYLKQLSIELKIISVVMEDFRQIYTSINKKEENEEYGNRTVNGVNKEEFNPWQIGKNVPKKICKE